MPGQVWNLEQGWSSDGGKEMLVSSKDTAYGCSRVAIPIPNFQPSSKTAKRLAPKTGELLPVGLLHKMRNRPSDLSQGGTGQSHDWGQGCHIVLSHSAVNQLLLRCCGTQAFVESRGPFRSTARPGLLRQPGRQELSVRD